MVRRAIHLPPLAVLALLASCSEPTSRCTLDTDCPGLQRCIAGTCQLPDPCGDKVCPAGQICRDGRCLDPATDEDGDGFPVTTDCDDSAADVHPGAVETCDERDENCDGQTDEDLFCGQDCQPVDESPVQQPPFACDQDTPCERCALYERVSYYCRSLDGSAYAWVAIPQGTPCDRTHHCVTSTCEGSRVWHCDARAGGFVAGGVPTAAGEICDGWDDDCNGAIDDAALDELCPPRDHASATCGALGCQYTCAPGFHECGLSCLDSASSESCGTRCEPCPAPEHGQGVCVAGDCDFACEIGYYRDGAACLACDDELRCGPSCSPCAAGTNCCGDGCYNLLLDPLHCGACTQYCPDAGYTCCSGLGCCAPTSPQCCGDYCCASDDLCCNGGQTCCPAGGRCCTDGCCPPPTSVCCGPGCCDDGTTCCNDEFCCTPEYPNCCPDGCCGAGYGVCCGPGCCPDGTNCCANQYCCDPGDVCCPNGCCPSDYPICCTSVCCPSGTTCCEGGTACCAV